jgi:hypothetical protein
VNKPRSNKIAKDVSNKPLSNIKVNGFIWKLYAHCGSHPRKELLLNS